MCAELKTEVYELFKKKLVACVMIIWINNSTFSVINFLLKIIRYIKSKIESRKVEPEEKSDQRIVVTNLCT